MNCTTNQFNNNPTEFVLVVVGIIFFMWIVYVLFANERATFSISTEWRYWETKLAQYGFKIEEITGYDCAPCEVKYRISNSHINVTLPSRKALTAIRKIISGKDVSYLIPLSKWSSCKIPE